MISATLLLSPFAQSSGIFNDELRERLASLVNVIGVISPTDTWGQHPEIMARTEVILTSWGAPVMNESFLAAAPRLRAVFYAAGTVRYFVTDALWKRNVKVTTARTINAIPTSEYAAAAILLSLKRAWHYARYVREARTFPKERVVPGAYRRTVGLVSYGAVGRLVRERLRAHELEIIVHDPHLDCETAARDQIRLVSLDELFSLSDVVSVHTPLLPETRHLIKASQFKLLRPNASFINTARGEVVDESGMLSVAQHRPDLQFVIDVATEEPPPSNSLLYTLPNVFFTPHLAGSGGSEYRRLGEAMVDELERYVHGRDLQFELSPSAAASVA